MESAYRTAIQARFALAKHAEALASMIAVVCTAGVCPLPAWGQSAVWQPLGATTGNIYYNGGNVGIGTTNPQYDLHLSRAGSWTQFMIENTQGTGETGLLLKDVNRTWKMGISVNGIGGCHLGFQRPFHQRLRQLSQHSVLARQILRLLVVC